MKRKHQDISQAFEPQHRERLLVKALLGPDKVPVRLLVDSGASGPILNQQLVQEAQLATKKRRQPLAVTTATGDSIPGAGQHYLPPTHL